MRRIFLLRHAKSSWDDPGLDDHERPLSPRGEKAARAMAAHLRRAKVRPGLILCSTALRTRQTHDLLDSAVAGVPVVFEPGLYESTRSMLLERLHRLDPHLNSVMVIGHNPGLERLARFLCDDLGEAAAVEALNDKFPTGALAELDSQIGHWAELDGGTCRLVSFLRPRDLD